MSDQGRSDAVDDALPTRADVVVIGAGIVGVSAALSLAERGLSVVVCEKGRIGGEQSTRNWGWCRKMGRDPAEIPLAVESARLWREMNARVGAETGYREAGIFYLCQSAREIAKYEEWLGHARAHQLDSHILPRTSLAGPLPSLRGRWEGALYTPSDGRAEPSLATAAIARAAQRAGAQFAEHCAVRGLETSAGAVSAAVTERGVVQTSRVLLAGGAWTRLFCGNLGVDFPQLRVLGSVMRTKPLDGPPDCAVAGADFAFRKRLDGGYTIAQKNANIADIVPDSFRLFFRFLPAFRSEGNEIRLRLGGAFLDAWRTPKRWPLTGVSPFETTRVLDPAPSKAILDQGLRRLIEHFPEFTGAEVAKRWGCAIDVTPDAVPVISNAVEIPGLTIASGFSGHGFGVGPAAGQLAADLLLGAPPLVDPTPYALSRFRRRRSTAVKDALAAAQ